jgi:FkbM family methyltransferase
MLRNFDPEVVETIVKFADRDAEEIFWDIGANKGACSYQIAHALPKCKIVAVEPQASLISTVALNLAEIARERFEIFPVGIGDKSEVLPLSVPANNKGAASFVRDVGPEAMQVRVEPAEYIQKQTGSWPTLVKIDVEGFESNVVKSLFPAFSLRTIKCCVFECHATERDSFAEVRSYTEPWGYKTHAIRRSLFSTWLQETTGLIAGSTDYAIVRSRR